MQENDYKMSIKCAFVKDLSVICTSEPFTVSIGDLCTIEFIEIVPLDTPSDNHQVPEVIYRVVASVIQIDPTFNWRNAKAL